MGEIKLDLTEATIPEGEHKLTIQGLIGEIEVLVPRHVGVSAWGRVNTAGSVKVLGQQADGISRSLEASSPDFDSAPRKVKIEASLMVGEVSIEYGAA